MRVIIHFSKTDCDNCSEEASSRIQYRSASLFDMEYKIPKNYNDLDPSSCAIGKGATHILYENADFGHPLFNLMVSSGGGCKECTTTYYKNPCSCFMGIGHSPKIERVCVTYNQGPNETGLELTCLENAVPAYHKKYLPKLLEWLKACRVYHDTCGCSGQPSWPGYTKYLLTTLAQGSTDASLANTIAEIIHLGNLTRVIAMHLMQFPLSKNPNPYQFKGFDPEDPEHPEGPEPEDPEQPEGPELEDPEQPEGPELEKLSLEDPEGPEPASEDPEGPI